MAKKQAGKGKRRVPKTVLPGVPGLARFETWDFVRMNHSPLFSITVMTSASDTSKTGEEPRYIYISKP